MTTFVGYDKNLRHEAERPALALTKHFATGFDYDQVTADRRDAVQQHEAAIVTLLSRCAADCIAIGKHLLEVRELLGGRLFSVWCAASFRFGQATCSNYMAMARRFADADPAAIARCDIGALAELSRERVPDAARHEAMQLAVDGQRISQSVAYAITEKHQAAAQDEILGSPRPRSAARPGGARSMPANLGASDETTPAEASAPLSPKQRRELTNLNSVLRQMLRRQEGARRAEMAELAIEGLRDVLASYGLEYLLGNIESRRPRVASAARKVREAGVPVLSD